MKAVIDVRFKDAGKAYYFNPGEFEIKEGDGVIVETSRGVEFGEVAQGRHEIPDEMVVAQLKQIIRPATPEDWETRKRNHAKEGEAFNICNEKILAHNLDMKLVNVEYSFNGSKIIFYFTADGRVDFRELVKDLASVFRTRIELRQIGVRDEAKMLGGLGSCGRPVCCKSFLADFQSVSIKMAKEQNLSLSPTKISGLCGRLMCCLKYEQDCYESMRKQMPRPGREVKTPDGSGIVLENNVITEKTRVRVSLSDGTLDVREYPFRNLNRTDGGAQPAAAEFETDYDRDVQELANLISSNGESREQIAQLLEDDSDAVAEIIVDPDAPQGVVPQGSTSQHGAPQGNAPQGDRQQNRRRPNFQKRRSQGDKPQGDRPQGSAPRNGAPQGGAPQGGAPQGGAPQGGAPQGGAPQGDRPQSNRPPRPRKPQGDRSQGDRQHGGRPQNGAPQGNATHGNAPQGGAPQNSAPQGNAPQGTAQQGNAPQGAAPQSAAPRVNHSRRRHFGGSSRGGIGRPPQKP